MKKFLTPIFVLLFVFTLSSNATTVNELNDTPVDECTVTMSIDCDGDGVAEFTSTVDCEHRKAMRAFLMTVCGD